MMSFWINIDSSITTLEIQKLILDEIKVLFLTLTITAELEIVKSF